MARIRTIKPDFFTSEDIVALSPLARLLYIATWCEADKEGRLEWKLGTFKLRYLPGDACDIEALADELVARGLVVLYGDGLAHIPAFQRHQHINPRESASTLPDPAEQPRKATRRDASTTRQPRVPHASARDGDAHGGREGKGKEGVIPPIPPTGGPRVSDFPPGFERFWEAYPRKVGKDAAARAFAARRFSPEAIEAVVAAVLRQRSGEQWARDGGRFIPHPSTWITQGRWQDEPGPAASAGTASDLYAGAL